MPERVLIIEDDIHIGNLVQLHLQEAGYTAEIITDGSNAIGQFAKHAYSLVIVDLMLPGLEGKEVIKKIRALNSEVPILITTVKSDLMHKVIGFELGADDYLAKPFDILELVMRSKALIRRGNLVPAASVQDEILQCGDIKVDVARRKTYRAANEIQLSVKLFDLLVFLMRNAGRPFTRNELLGRVWDYEHEGYEHTVDTHINRLRNKIEPNASKPVYVLTVWGVGYRFAEAHEIQK